MKRRVERVRRCPLGAEPVAGGTHLRVWAPHRRRVRVVLEDGDERSLEREPDGYFSALLGGVGPGQRYRLRLDAEELLPDPVSRRQPEGPHGPSEIVDPDAFRWTDGDWLGVGLDGQVIYEMHVGTFTPEGTWQAAAGRLDHLRRVGVTLVEMMPVAEFPGRFGWGYDGVGLFAPTRLYGTPDDLRFFIDRAHAFGIAVILDVVYNHLGPDGNYLARFDPAYFSERYRTDWGDALNFDGPGCAAARSLFTANAACWIGEYHFDGLRIDATQDIHDASPSPILAEIVRAARDAAGGRSILVIGENEPQDASLLRSPAAGGFGFDALWNDDFHHSAMVALTGHDEAYYADYGGTPQELVSVAKRGYLYQGQRSAWQGKPRGTPAGDIPAAAFVNYFQNHDQIANSARGFRIDRLTSPGRLRAVTALLLLLPGTPMLFQGQEFGASAPFHYFADHAAGLAPSVRRGRAAFLAQFPSIMQTQAEASLPDPGDPATFVACRLDWAEAERHTGTTALHADLLRLRREDPVFQAQGAHRVDGAVLAPEAFLLRFPGEAGDDRLLLVNLGHDLRLAALAEPLAAPPSGQGWRLLWSSEDVRYGGGGTAAVESDAGWRLPGHAALVLAPAPVD